jgi:ATP/maltotriose-dependent transcriptional regulator MalT
LPMLWEPLMSFVYSADILGNDGDTRQFIKLLQACHQHADPASLVVALFSRAFFARVNNHLDKAGEDLSECLKLLLASSPSMSLAPAQQLFCMVVQAELARVQEHYPRAQAYTETALALAQVYGDHYTLGTLLIDQVLFTYHQGQFADTRIAFLRLRELAQHTETPHFRERSHAFEQRLSENEHTPRAQPKLLTVLQTPTGLHEPLSTRENEVLRLLTEGLSNREIAQYLVITPSTVKKHLEHIYSKLDTHNRTSAIARARTLNLLS